LQTFEPDDDELSGDCDESNLGGLAVSAQAFIETLEARCGSDCGARRLHAIAPRGRSLLRLTRPAANSSFLLADKGP
jgi:hypothetical protein